MTDPKNLESWLHEKVGPAYDALKTDPSRAVTPDQVRARLAAEHTEVIRLSLADQECFAQALLSPPQPAPALERAFARRSNLLRVIDS